MIEGGIDGFADLIHGNGPHTSQIFTSIAVAAAAIQVMIDQAMPLLMGIRKPNLRFSGSKYAHHSRADRRRQMQGAAVIGDIDLRLLQNRSQLPQREPFGGQSSNPGQVANTLQPR